MVGAVFEGGVGEPKEREGKKESVEIHLGETLSFLWMAESCLQEFSLINMCPRCEYFEAGENLVCDGQPTVQ